MKSLSEIGSETFAVQSLFTGRLIKIPSYQREYAWDSKDVRLHFFDINSTIMGPDKGAAYLGQVLTTGPGKATDLVVVDGQQRITTMFIFLAACRDLLKEIAPDSSRIAKIQSHLVSSFDGQQICRITSQHRAANQALEGIAFSKPYDATARPASTYKNAFTVLSDLLADQYGGDAGQVEELVDNLLSSSGYLVVSVPEADATRIYLLTNDRGHSMGGLERLLAVLFDATPPADQEKMAAAFAQVQETVWSSDEKSDRTTQHLAAALVLTTKQTQPKCIEDLAKAAKRHPRKEVGFIEDELLPAAKAYVNCTKGLRPDGTVCPPLQDIGAVQRLRRFRGFRPVLVAGRTLANHDFDILAGAVRDLIFVLSVAGANPPATEADFVAWAADLRGRAPLGSVLAKIQARKEAHATSFWANMAGAGIPQLGDSGVRFVLGRLEQSLRVATGATSAARSVSDELGANIDVEHILSRSRMRAAGFVNPSSIIHRLGNLTLLEQAHNRSVKDEDYASKLSYYGKSSFLLTKSMAAPLAGGGKNNAYARVDQGLEQFPVWDDNALRARTTLLGVHIAATFGMPDPVVPLGDMAPAPLAELPVPQARPDNCREGLEALSVEAMTKSGLAEHLKGRSGRLGADERQAGYVLEALAAFGLAEAQDDSGGEREFALTDWAAGLLGPSPDAARCEAVLQEAFTIHFLGHPDANAVLGAKEGAARVEAIEAVTHYGDSTVPHRERSLRKWLGLVAATTSAGGVVGPKAA